ncbi:MAG: flagellar hook-length control protein FliK [Desulfobacteraceae bacterium]|nr:flagellar hook-length control protein FliK [Desulfobacteraceae bacterium]
MQTNLLIIDNQNTIPSKRPGHGKGVGKGLIEEGQEQGREETGFSSTLAEVANEQQSHPGSADESRVERKKSENGEAESKDLKKDANGETESEDLKKNANAGLAKAGKTSGPYLVLDRKTDARSGNERVVRGEVLPGSGLKGSLAKLKGINRGTQDLNQADHKTTMGLDKANALKVDLPGFGLERKQGESEGKKVAAKPQGLERVDGLLHEMEAKSATKGKETLKVTAKPQGLEKVEGLLDEMGAKSATKGQEILKVTAKPQGLEKVEGILKDFGEESGRINRGAQGQEQAAQKLRVGQMKGSPEEFAQKEPGTEGSAPRLGIEPKDARPETSETVKVKVLGGDLTHKKVEKTESNSGENSNLSSRNYSTPDKGTGAISHSKEPHVFTKSSQADTLRQIVKKAAFNLENGRSEFKIDLKPESLGHLKMQILTENHHVTVRILTENPLVKDMIESNLVQLKANFQNQGLEIEKFDVSVAQDSDKNGTGDGRYESKRMREKSGDTENGYGGKAEEPEEVDDLMRRGQQESAVDFFA